MTLANIERYQRVFLWVVAVFDRTLPEVIYEVAPQALEPYFAKWEELLNQRDGDWRLVRDHINNPKIPLKFIAQNGIRIWPPEATA